VNTDIGTGDSEVPDLTITPADNTTTATLTVTKPDGTSTGVPVSGGALTPITGSAQHSQQWAADTPVVYDQPGRWILAWTVTGTGEGSEDLEVYIVPSPVAGGPTWAPGRSRVANYVPERTLERAPASVIQSQDEYDLTFTSNTRPTGLAVDRLIADGVAWVSSRVYPMNARVEAAAEVVVALYAAAAVERGTPEGVDSLQRANDLEKRLDLMMSDLVNANNAANDSSDYGLEIVPVWSFPPAPCTPYPYYY
jgi:hypothetical protein